MVEQPKLRVTAASGPLIEAALNRVISENLDELNAIQAADGAPLFADPAAAEGEKP